MNKPLMPKATAIWLIENTSLTFQQIADFCGIHLIEVEFLANEDSGKNHGLNPIISGEVDEKEIKKGEEDPTYSLQYKESTYKIKKSKPEKLTQSKFKKQHKPEAILWLILNYEALTNYQIAKILNATPNVVKNIREKTYRNYSNLKPKNPIALGICTEEQIKKAVNKIKNKEVN